MSSASSQPAAAAAAPTGAASATRASISGASRAPGAASTTVTTGTRRALPSKSPLLSSSLPDMASPTLSSSGAGAAGVDHDDLFARAQAMGLRTTREEYERTRAGVTAFLRSSSIGSVAGDAAAAGPSSAAGASSAVGATGSLAVSGARSARNSPALRASASPRFPNGFARSPSIGISGAAPDGDGKSAGARTPVLAGAAHTASPALPASASAASPTLSFFTATVSVSQAQHTAAMAAAAAAKAAAAAAVPTASATATKVGTSSAAEDADSEGAQSGARGAAGRKLRGGRAGGSARTTPLLGVPVSNGTASATASASPSDLGPGSRRRGASASVSPCLSTHSTSTAQGTPRTLEQIGWEEERRRRKEKKRKLRAAAAAAAEAQKENASDADSQLKAPHQPSPAPVGLGLGLGLDMPMDDAAAGDESCDAAAPGASSLPPQTPAAHIHHPTESTPLDGTGGSGGGSGSGADADADAPQTAPRPWVSPSGTMRVVSTPLLGSSTSAAKPSGAPGSAASSHAPRFAGARGRRSPMPLAGPGAEDSPVLHWSGGHAAASATGFSSVRRASIQQQQHHMQRRAQRASISSASAGAGASSPNLAAITPLGAHARAANLAANGAAAGARPFPTLARSPCVGDSSFEEDASSSKHDGEADEDDDALPPNDSGVFFDQLDAEEQLDKAASQRAAAAAKRTAACTDGKQGASAGAAPPQSTRILQEEMGKMSFLDRVMQHKTSPVRKKKEAKAKERAQREWHEAMLQASSSDSSAQAATSKSVRWASSVFSPAALEAAYQGHTRLSTREHYDFINHGIHPSGSAGADGEGEGVGLPAEGGGLSMLTPSMLSAPWPEAHVEMLANMSASRAAAAAAGATGGSGTPGALDALKSPAEGTLAAFRRSSLLGSVSGSPGTRLGWSAMRSGAERRESTSGAAQSALSPLINSVPFAKPQARERTASQTVEPSSAPTAAAATATSAVRRAVVFATNSQGQALVSPVLSGSASGTFPVPTSSPMRAALGFFSASPPKAGKAWTASQRPATTGNAASPVLAGAAFSRDTANNTASAPHSRESTHQSPALAVNPAATQSVSSPVVEELLSTKAKGKGKGKAKEASAQPAPAAPAPVAPAPSADASARPTSDVASAAKPAAPKVKAKVVKSRKGNSSAAPSSDDAMAAPLMNQTPARAPSASAFFKVPGQGPGVPATKLTLPAPGLVRSLEWDRPDGTRVVKLVSEELQQAMDKGTITEEPEPRYYVLPVGWGKTKTKPTAASYAGLIGQAILTSSDGRLSLAEIYAWINTSYPFYERGERGWQNSIRHNLSLNKSFEKIEREANLPGKGGWWAIQKGHEDRFQGNIYLATPSRNEPAPTPSRAPKQPKTPVSERDAARQPGTGGSSMSVDGAVPSSTTGSAGQRRKRQESAGDQPAQAEIPSSSSQAPAGKADAKGSKRLKTIARLLPFDEKVPSAQSMPAPQAHAAPSRAGAASTPLRPAHMYAPGGSGQSAVPMLTDSASSPPSSPFYHALNMPPPAAGRKRKAVEAVEVVEHADQSGMASAMNFSQSFGMTGVVANSSPMSFNGSPVSARNPQQHRSVYTAGIPVSRARPMEAHSQSSMQMQAPAPVMHQSPMSAAREAPGPQSGPGPSPRSMAVSQSPGSKTRAMNLRGSPLKSTLPFAMSPTRASKALMMQNNAGMQLHAAMMHVQPAPASHASMQRALTVPTSSTPARVGLAGSNMRWTNVATPSPMRRGGSAQSVGSSGSAANPWLDDPFDYQGNLQHELEFAMDSFGSVTDFASPMRGMMWQADPNSSNTHFPHPV